MLKISLERPEIMKGMIFLCFLNSTNFSQVMRKMEKWGTLVVIVSIFVWPNRTLEIIHLSIYVYFINYT